MSWVSPMVKTAVDLSFRCTFAKVVKIPTRSYPAPPKRFYKRTGVVHANGKYEITLDHRKLKTPKGNIFTVDNEMLALLVAQEWDSEKDVIHRSTMHLTSLCNTAQDNPNGVTKESAVNNILSYLESDTVLFLANEANEPDLSQLQERELMPVISWFSDHFNVKMSFTRDISNPVIPEETKSIIQKHFLSFDLNTLFGFTFAVESLKSVILALGCAERKLTPDQAVLLSRLEEEYQANRWGKVEWAHDVSKFDLEARVSAAILFVHLSCMSEDTKSKLVSVI